MKARNAPDHLSALVIAMLLILTAWGNALAMLIVSAAGLILAILFGFYDLTEEPPTGRRPNNQN